MIRSVLPFRLIPLAVVLSVLFALPVDAAVLGPALADRMRGISPDGEVPVIITLADRAEPGAVFGRNRRARRERIIQALRDRAQRTQGPLLGLLAARGGRKVLPLWIRNAVSATIPASVVDIIRGFPGVESIVLDAVIQAPVPTIDLPSAPEWNLSMVGAPDLWDLGYRGEGIVVAGMDTGVDADHPDLQAKWRGGANSWFDPNGEHAAPFDAAGHGTFTMGIMVGGDAGGTSIGIAPDAQWIAVKIFNDAGSASYSSIHAGFQWLLDPDGNPSTDDAPDVVNNSWSFKDAEDRCITEFEQDIQVLRESGIAVVFSSGNSGPAPYTSVSPANNEGSFSVGAVDSNEVIWEGSSRGPSACGGRFFPHAVAPGVSIKSSGLSLGGMAKYVYGTGTSAAAPHVSGGMALLAHAFPEMVLSKLEWAITVSAMDLGAPGTDSVHGYGLMDLSAAYDLLRSPDRIGVYDPSGLWWIDGNGNGAWDGTPTDANAFFGYLGAIPVTGGWDGSGTTKIGVYDDIGLWWVDLNGNGAWDGTPTDANYWFGYPGAIPVTGDWDGSGTTKIAVYDDGIWYVDLNGNGAWDGTPTDANYWFGYPGAIPVTGDWDGSGRTKIAVYDPSGLWWVDMNGNGIWDGTPTDANYWFGYSGAMSVVGKW